MKPVKTFFAITVIALIVSIQAMAQSEPTVIAIVNKAEWCSVCKANGERAMATFMKNNEDGSIKFLANDLTNEQTKMKSKEALKMVGMDKFIDKYQGTGLVSFFNSRTKALICQISVSETNDKLAAIMQTVKNNLN